MAVNVARKVSVIGRRDEGTKKIVPPDKRVVQRLLAVAPHDFRTQLLFAAATGVRAGELHALRWRHLDFNASEVTIETRVDRHRKEDVTKTKAGMRTIPLSAALVAALEAWRKQGWRKKPRGRRRELRNVVPLESVARPEDLVFPNRWGGFESHTNMINRKFLPLFTRLAALHTEDPAMHPKAPARFNWHALRHFAISCWIEAGLAPKTVQTFAGHSSLAVTMDRYGHLFRSDDHRRAMDAIAGGLV